MGLPMPDIHEPSIASSANDVHGTSKLDEHISFAELLAQKEKMESELKALGSVLASVCLFLFINRLARADR